MLFSKADHKPEKVKKLPVGIQIPPIDPGNLIVLTIGVVVAHGGIAELVTGKKHRRSPAAH